MKALFFRTLPFLNTFVRGYRHVFSIGEIEENKTLQWFFGAMLFYFFVTFEGWVMSSQVTAGVASNAVCWPHYPDCGWLYFLNNLPNGYSHTAFYMGLYAIILLVVYLMWKRQWVAAHACMLALFAWKFIIGFFASYGILGMYDHYHLILTAALLFIPHKEYFSKTLFVVLYFVSATIKFHPAWILGTYFSTLQGGLALFPDIILPIITGSVILEQVVGCWFLLSRHKWMQRTALAYFVIFHLYSGVFVLYNYPSATLPALLILFGPLYHYQRPPLTRKAIAGWLMVAMIFALQLPSVLGDTDAVRITDANNRYGMWMFDANHQCVITAKFRYGPYVELAEQSSEAPGGTPCNGFECTTASRTYRENNQWVREIRRESAISWQRCDPYEKWRYYKNRCGTLESVGLQLDHSINGGPFYRIIDEENICDLEYNLSGPNPWIQAPPEAPAVGIPVKNVYRYPSQQYLDRQF